MLDPELLRSYNGMRTTPNTGVFCHAPFASMNFTQNGDAIVCCYNRKYVLGKYPSSSLDEIWNGSRARDLRRSMARNDLPQGCDICLSQFASSNFSGLRARAFDHLSEPEYVDTGQRLLSHPKLMEFEISNVCNLECTMCSGFFSSSIRHNRENLPPFKSPYDDAFVHQLEAFIPHLQEARFLGGEPFLIRTYYQIWDLIAALNPAIRVSITTNATILNERVKATLDMLNAHVIVSMDSLSRETYERIRINAEFDQVMRNLDYFVDYTRGKGTWLALAVCPMRQNWRELPAIVQYCNDRGIGVFFNTVTFPGDATLLHMTHAELEAAVANLQSVQLHDGTDVQRANNEHYRDLVRQITGYREGRSAFRGAMPTVLPAADWSLKTWNACSASLAPIADSEGAIRLSVSDMGPPGTGGAAVASRAMPLRTDRRYSIEFRARSEEVTELTVGAHRARLPQENLGLYQRFGLSSEWERFEVDFVPSDGDDNAQLLFHAAHRVADIDLADVTIRAVPVDVSRPPSSDLSGVARR